MATAYRHLRQPACRKTSGFLVLLVFLGVGLTAASLFSERRIQPPRQAINLEDLPGLEISAAPWPAEISNLRDRLTVIGLPALSEEGKALHTHQHIDIFINGKPVPVPAGIGIGPAKSFISPIHTHDGSGIIHVESPWVQTFTLGQFFDVWGVRFDSGSIGGYAKQPGQSLQVFVNGRKVQDDPRALALAAHQEIVVTYGKSTEMPARLPTSYDFPAGL